MKRFLVWILIFAMLLNTVAFAVPEMAGTVGTVEEAVPKGDSSSVLMNTCASNWDSDYRYWSQASSYDAGMVEYGCWVVAQAKLIYETGIDRSNDFNPDIYFEWEKANGYINPTTYKQINGVNAPVVYANSKGKKLNYLGTQSFSADKILENVDNNYWTILKVKLSSSKEHFVLVANELSKQNGEVWIYNSYTNDDSAKPTSLSERNYYDHVEIYTYSADIDIDGYLHKSLDDDDSIPEYTGKWIKKSYTSDSDLIGAIPYGECAVVTEYSPDGKWGYVEYKGKKGWTYLDSKLFPLESYYTCPVVTFNANGGSVSESEKKVYINATYGTLPTPSRTGYTFNGWYTASNGGTQITSGTVVNLTSNQTLYAHWKANTYTVKYNANGGSGSMSNSSHTYDTAKALTSNAFTRNGYSFLGWSTDSSATSAKYTNGQSVKNLTSTNGATVNLYAIWSEISKYTVSYNANGGSGAPASQTKTYGVNLTLSTTVPTRTGYTFKGWATSANGSVAYASGASYSANANVTLYAVWQANTYTVKYNANGGSGAPASQTKTHGVNLTLRSEKPTKTGYTFKGWSTSNDSTVEYAPGASYSTNANVTLYAVWVSIPTTDNYIEDILGKFVIPLEGEDNEDFWWIDGYKESGLYAFLINKDDNVLPEVIVDGKLTEAYKDQICIYTRIDDQGVAEGIKSLGYSVNPETGEYDGLSQSTVVLDSTEPTQFICTHDEGEITKLAGTRHSIGTLDRDVVFKSDTKFIIRVKDDVWGYCYLEFDGNQYSNMSYIYDMEFEHMTYVLENNVESKTKEDLVILYACEDDDIGLELHKLNFMAQSCGTRYVAQGYAYGTLPIPEKDGYIFDGWSTTQNGSNKITSDTIVNLSEEHQYLYPCWKKICSITYSPNGGNGATLVQELLKGDTETIIEPSYERNGYSFQGWSTSADGEVEYVPGESYTINEDLTLYAVWVANTTYEVIYYANCGSGEPKNQTKTHGVDIKLSTAAPVREGYEFIGWSSNSNGIVDYQPGDVFVQNKKLELIAVWKKTDNSDVVFSADNESLMYHLSGVNMCWPVKDDSTGETYYQMRITNSTNPLIAFPYERFNAEKYKFMIVDFSVEADEGFDEKMSIYFKNDVYTELNEAKTFKYSFKSSTEETRHNVIFDLSNNEYWTGLVDFVRFDPTSKSTGTVKLYGITFTDDITYNVNYDLNGGSGNIPSQVKSHGKALTLSSTIPTKTGYTFKGWSTSNDSTVEYASGATYSTNSNVKLYAVWQANTYTVTYNANGGSGAPANQTKTHGVNLTLSSTKPTKTGYTFKGWSTSNDSTVEYAPGASYSANANVTLYAVWELIEVEEPVNPDAPVISASSVKTRAGEKVTVSLSVENNPGIAGLQFNVSYDSSVLTLVNISDEDKDVKLSSILSDDYSKNPYGVSFFSATNDSSNGLLFTMDFEVAPEAENGTYDISVNIENACDQSLEKIDFSTVNGSVTVIDVLLGDNNGDGGVDIRDVVLLAQYCAGWESAINRIQEAAADSNGDGSIDIRDVVLLAQFCAGWDVSLG